MARHHSDSPMRLHPAPRRNSAVSPCATGCEQRVDLLIPRAQSRSHQAAVQACASSGEEAFVQGYRTLPAGGLGGYPQSCAAQPFCIFLLFRIACRSGTRDILPGHRRFAGCNLPWCRGFVDVSRSWSVLVWGERKAWIRIFFRFGLREAEANLIGRASGCRMLIRLFRVPFVMLQGPSCSWTS